MLFPAKIRVGLAGLAIAGGAAAALALGPAGLAVGQSSPPTVGQSSPPIQVQIKVNSPATLVAKGAAVDVSVTASCSGTTTPGGVFIEIVENDKGNIAYGYGENFTLPSCTGTSQTFTLLVTAGNSGPSGIAQGPSAAFAKGVAIANANIQSCSNNGLACANQVVEPVIKIKK